MLALSCHLIKMYVIGQMLSYRQVLIQVFNFGKTMYVRVFYFKFFKFNRSKLHFSKTKFKKVVLKLNISMVASQLKSFYVSSREKPIVESRYVRCHVTSAITKFPPFFFLKSHLMSAITKCSPLFKKKIVTLCLPPYKFHHHYFLFAI